MHDYLATDGVSLRQGAEEADARRKFYSGIRDKNKVINIECIDLRGGIVNRY